MTRAELEHAIRAACDLSGDTEVIVFGSQAILGQFPNAPATLRQSAEADIAPKHAIDKVDRLDAILGEDSQFHQSHGFYVLGVSLETATLPSRWEERAVKVQNRNPRDFIGWCIEAHDLAASKLAAFREKDLEFVRALLVEKMVTPRKRPCFSRDEPLMLQSSHRLEPPVNPGRFNNSAERDHWERMATERDGITQLPDGRRRGAARPCGSRATTSARRTASGPSSLPPSS